MATVKQILEIAKKEIRDGPGASAWGRINNGWISLDYVAVL